MQTASFAELSQVFVHMNVGSVKTAAVRCYVFAHLTERKWTTVHLQH